MSEKETHERALTEAIAQKEEANNLSIELDNAGSKIDQLIGNRRSIREESSSSQVTCGDIVEFIKKINEAVKLKVFGTAIGYAKEIATSATTCSEEEKKYLTSRMALMKEAKYETEKIILSYHLALIETEQKINQIERNIRNMGYDSANTIQ